jgi:cell division protein FtsZ
MSQSDRLDNPKVRIKVLGVGGSGCHAVDTMIRSHLTGVDFITVNTDERTLGASLAAVKIAIGHKLTQGLGAGADPELGKKAAIEDQAKIREALAGADLVFIIAGLGGGTGTGAAPVFAKIAQEAGALTIGVVAKPFQFEGQNRMRIAEQGIQEIRENVDLLVTIPNERLISSSCERLSIVEAFKKADEALLNAVRGISDLISQTALINCDFAHVKTVMKNKGPAFMGLGYASGEKRALNAATQAISSPFLEGILIAGATSVIVNVSTGSNLSIQEMNQSISLVMEAVHGDAEIICGTVIDKSLGDQVRVTVIATGLIENLHSASVKELSTSVAAADAKEPPTGATATDPKDPKDPKDPTRTISRARGIGERLGITDLTNNPLNIPSYFKRPPSRDA